MPDPYKRADLVRAWTVLPDHASVNWHEEGADLVAQALLDRGIKVEAGIYSGSDAAVRFASSPLARHVMRILAEVVDVDPDSATLAAAGLLKELDTQRPLPILLHGQEGGAWPVLRMASALALDARIGLEDVLQDSDGRPVSDNSILVSAARNQLDTFRLPQSQQPHTSKAAN